MSEYDPFAEIYDIWADVMTEDVPFYVELAREADGPVAELAVGTGRVAIPVARETGKRILGFDLSPAMLAIARDRVKEAGVDVELHEQDMRDFALDEPAALVYCPFRALLHMPTWADRRRVFERVSAALKPGGRFAWNVFVFDMEIATYLQGRVRPHGPTSNVWEYTTYDQVANRIDIRVWVGQPGLDERKLSLYWVNRSEWEGLVDVAGLEVEALYGWFDRRPFDEDSREFVWVARKPG
jgi:ubiquinone/menaquinone biosynthesis C-methylase UbiE